MINVHRLFALSSTAVIVAACGGGGGSAPAAPRPAASAAGTTPALTAHAANTTLTLTFPKNYVRFKNVRTPNPLRHKKAANAARRSAKTSIAKRGTKFIDPSSGTDLQIEVTNYNSSNGATSSYMAAVNVPIVDSQSNAQTIPIYLAPGNDTILVQETYGYEGPIEEYQGYLLAQGTSNVGISEGSANPVSVTMQIVMSGAIAATDPTPNNGTNGYMSTTNGPTYPTICIENDQTVYFIPVDALSGTYVYTQNPGNIAPTSDAFPFQSVSVVPNYGATTFSGTLASENEFGGYTVAFDANNDPITFAVTFSGTPEDPYFGPFPNLGEGTTTYPPVPSSTETYYALISSTNNCPHTY